MLALHDALSAPCLPVDFRIIQNFQIADIKLDGVSGKAGLLLWYKRQVSDYDVKVSNFSSSFRSGLAFCGAFVNCRVLMFSMNDITRSSFTVLCQH